jgi:hypothetical protein
VTCTRAAFIAISGHFASGSRKCDDFAPGLDVTLKDESHEGDDWNGGQ